MPNYHQHPSTSINLPSSDLPVTSKISCATHAAFASSRPSRITVSGTVGGAYRCMVHRGSAAPCIGQETPGDQKVGLLGRKKHGNLAIKRESSLQVLHWVWKIWKCLKSIEISRLLLIKVDVESTCCPLPLEGSAFTKL